MRKILLAATMLVGGGLLIGAPAHAAFVNSSNDFFSVPVESTITFTFVGKRAGDRDFLINVNGVTTEIFDNQNTPVGTQFITVFGPGQYSVQLRDDTAPNLNTWNPGTNNPNGDVHLKSTLDFNDFNLGFGPPVAAGINGWYGWEDRPIPDSDSDYNDLIFTVNATPTTGNIPEPMSLALLGVGVAGAGLARMRKGKRA